MNRHAAEFHFFTVDEYTESGCMQMEVPDIGRGLWLLTRGKMCDGCPAYDNGRCGALIKMMNAKRGPIAVNQQAHTETVRQEAARRGISISEVRRQRNAAANGEPK